MGKAPAFQLYAGDFFLDTMEWELEELGLYSRLLFYEWVNGPLPREPRKLAKISLIGARKLAQLWPKIAPKFIEKDGFYVNLRLEETRTKQLQFQENQRLKGVKSGEKRRTAAQPRLEPEDNRPWLNPSSSSSSSNNKKNNANHADTRSALDFFIQEVNQRKGFKPEVLTKDVAMVNRRLKALPLDRVQAIILFYLDNKKSENHISLSAALSSDTYNTYMLTWNNRKWEHGDPAEPPTDQRWWQ